MVKVRLCLLLLQSSYAWGLLHSVVRGCCFGTHLRIGLPPASLPPYNHYDASTNKFRGFITDFLDEIAGEMGFTFSMVHTRGESPFASLDNDAADIVLLLEPNVPEEAVPVAALLSQYYRTSPILTAEYVAIRYRTLREETLFSFVEPFETDLWVAIIVVITLLAGCFTLLSAVTEQDSDILTSLRNSM
jgi:ABC-type amino acid transport substrate-binding protein